MREIKFRGLRTDGKVWIIGDLAYFFNQKKSTMIMPNCYFGTRDLGDEDENENPIISNEMALGGFINVIPESVGQFTGLKDKNGKDIYEGDKFKPIYNSLGNLIKIPILKYEDLEWTLEEENANERPNNFEYLNEIEPYLLEIIGNIHEKPELCQH